MRMVKDMIWRIVCQELQNGHEKIDLSSTMKRQISYSFQVKDKDPKLP